MNLTIFKLITFIILIKVTKVKCFENKTIGEFCEQRLNKKIFLKVSDIDEYINNVTENNELRTEFEKIPLEQLFIWDDGEKEENIKKNRYKNIIAYDHSRVIINQTENKNDSDYINANFINGIINKNRYIATQSPMVNTVNNFWQMIWDENVHIIVMLDKLNSYKYWPFDINRYNNIEVNFIKADIFTDEIIIRTFVLINKRQVRTLKQYQFTNWSDDKLPEYTNNFLSFVNLIRNNRDYKPTRPILVHDLKGTGKTGTYILIDSLLEVGTRLKKIDIVSQLCLMRQMRINLIETYDQYVFVYNILKEAKTQLNEKRNDFFKMTFF